MVTSPLKKNTAAKMSKTTKQQMPLNLDTASASENIWSLLTHLEHEHSELLVVFPLLHCRVHVGWRGRQRGAAALTGELSVELSHLLKLLPQVLGDDLGPFYTNKPHGRNQRQRTAVKGKLPSRNDGNHNSSSDCLHVNHLPMQGSITCLFLTFVSVIAAW